HRAWQGQSGQLPQLQPRCRSRDESYRGTPADHAGAAPRGYRARRVPQGRGGYRRIADGVQVDRRGDGCAVQPGRGGAHAASGVVRKGLTHHSYELGAAPRGAALFCGRAPARRLRDNAALPVRCRALAESPLKKSDFDFELPPELIAQAPLPERSASRMLLLDVAAQARQDRMFRELPDFLRPGDLLVFNDTRVLPARLYGRKESGGAVEILIERVTGSHEAIVQLGVSKKPKEGGRIELADGSHAVVLGRDEGFFRLRFEAPEPLEKLLLKLGEMPLPPYIERHADASDMERYQTVFAREPGAVAAPTAGLHFDEAILARLRERGVEFGYVTLHVGAGTFQPVRVDN